MFGDREQEIGSVIMLCRDFAMGSWTDASEKLIETTKTRRADDVDVENVPETCAWPL